jgi:hypothetical protein
MGLPLVIGAGLLASELMPAPKPAVGCAHFEPIEAVEEGDTSDAEEEDSTE